MADRKVSYILEVDYEAETAVLRARQDLDALGESGRSAAENVEQTSSGLQKVGTAAVAVGAGLVAAGVAFNAIADGAAKAYEALGEGAALSKANSDFEAFAENIGTTAQLLEEDLYQAMGGLQSRSDMLAAATSLMSQGLAKSHDEAVALAEVSGQLGWNMDVLALTLNNQSFMRLDTLGLAVDAVKPKIAELEATGYSADEAFKWGLIEAARDKLEITGGVAETTAGKLMILESTMANVQDAFKVSLAEGAADGIASTADSLLERGDQLEDAAGVVGYAAGQALGQAFSLGAAAVTSGETSRIEATALALGASVEDVWNAYETARRRGAQEGMSALEVQLLQQELLNQLIEDQLSGLELVNEAARDYSYTWGGVATAASEADAVIATSVETMKDWQYQLEIVGGPSLAQLEAGMEAQQGLAVKTAEAWQAYTAQMTQAGASNFTQYANQVDEGTTALESMDEIMYEIAQKHGAGIDFLGDFGVDAGLISEEAAAAGEAMAQQIQIAESLAAAVERGVMAWDDYPAAVERALAALESGEAARPGGGRPSGAQIYEPGAEPTGAAATGQGYAVPLEVELVDEAIQQAVDEARGIVEGFTSPEEAYEAVMTMNIDDVREKGGEVESLIARLPNQKRITIDVSLVGLDQLQQLQNLGVLP